MAEPNFAPSTLWVGDNLDILRGVNSECVDLIYLDPPFNSNQDYATPIGLGKETDFKDIWTLDDIDIHEHGEMSEKSPAAHAVIAAAREAHGKGMMAYLIMMGTRLLEMHRILKPTGSIYLHCDDAAGHYLKMLLDAIFGKDNFLNSITWRRAISHSDANRYGRISDYLLFYSKSPGGHVWTDHRVPQDQKDLEERYSATDAQGRKYYSGDLTGAGASKGKESVEPWKGYDVAQRGRHWAPPKKGDYADYIDKHLIPGYKKIAGVHARLDALDQAGMIVHPKGRGFWPGLKRYAKAAKNKALQSIIWKPTGLTNYSVRDEPREYATQKPLALLELIIRASSKPGDLIFDPFCGCATALVMADSCSRRWAGCDISPKAGELVRKRIAEDQGMFKDIQVLSDPPLRDDTIALPNYRQHRHRLYGEQEGICPGCGIFFPFGGMTTDHKLPKKKGGTDHFDNLQLLCLGCNSSKGSRTMAEWRAWQEANRPR